ncbi:uncharacterized protein V3H82_024200 [Fundulus diaphanus]
MKSGKKSSSWRHSGETGGKQELKERQDAAEETPMMGDVFQPRVLLHPSVLAADVKEEAPEEQSPEGEQQESEPLHIKEEQEEPGARQEGEQLLVKEETDSSFPLTAAPINSFGWIRSPFPYKSISRLPRPAPLCWLGLGPAGALVALGVGADLRVGAGSFLVAASRGLALWGSVRASGGGRGAPAAPGGFGIAVAVGFPWGRLSFSSDGGAVPLGWALLGALLWGPLWGPGLWVPWRRPLCSRKAVLWFFTSTFEHLLYNFFLSTLCINFTYTNALSNTYGGWAPGTQGSLLHRMPVILLNS